MADPEVYKGDGGEVNQLNERLAAVTTELEQAYARWEELEAIAEAARG
ncbi:MAG: ABC transporter C-terminal domain-containing protein [Planctomycetota bacterium]